jgi:hypothetical protein
MSFIGFSAILVACNVVTLQRVQAEDICAAANVCLVSTPQIISLFWNKLLQQFYLEVLLLFMCILLFMADLTTILFA